MASESFRTFSLGIKCHVAIHIEEISLIIKLNVPKNEILINIIEKEVLFLGLLSWKTYFFPQIFDYDNRTCYLPSESRKETVENVVNCCMNICREIHLGSENIMF